MAPLKRRWVSSSQAALLVVGQARRPVRAPATHARAGAAQEEIGEAVGLFRQDVAKAVEAQKMEDLPKSAKLLATYTDAEWKPPLYDIAIRAPSA